MNVHIQNIGILKDAEICLDGLLLQVIMIVEKVPLVRHCTVCIMV